MKKLAILLLISFILGCSKGRLFLEGEMFIQPKFTLSSSKREVFFVKEKDLKKAVDKLTLCVVSKGYPEVVFVEDFTLGSSQEIHPGFLSTLKNLTEESFINRWVYISKNPDKGEIIKGEVFWEGKGTDLFIFLKAIKDNKIVATCSQAIKVQKKR